MPATVNRAASIQNRGDALKISPLSTNTAISGTPPNRMMRAEMRTTSRST